MPRKDYVKTQLTDVNDGNLPIVALVGRPNVGKSTMFNRLTRSRRAIVDPTPGMTRDRLYGTLHRGGGSYRLVDTGGLETDTSMIPTMIRDQTNLAIKEAAVIVFMIDGREGLTAADEDIASALRQLAKPTLLLVNKMDEGEDKIFDTSFYRLGFEHVIFASSEHGRGIEDLLDCVESNMDGLWVDPTESEDEPPIRMAIIGRPNAGKSSLVNKILDEDRVMVSEVAGTTRDPIDSFVSYSNRTFCLIDTAGIRKRGKISGSQESLSVMMARRQVESADVIALLIDATDLGAHQDSAIAGIAVDAHKPLIIVINKWDLIEDKETQTAAEFEDKLRRRLKFLETSPFIFISAKSGQRVHKVLEMAATLNDRAGSRITTGVLNRFVERMKNDHRIPTHKGRGFKIFYMTQVSTRPPTFMVVVNTKQDLHFSQERFLMNRIRDAVDLDGVPIRLIIKPRKQND